jgi:hypothetical protein
MGSGLRYGGPKSRQAPWVNLDGLWLLNDRRKYERLTANSVAMIQISMIQLLLNRLA